MSAVKAVRAVRFSDGSVVAVSALEEFEGWLDQYDGNVASALAVLYGSALRENWCREQVAAAGKDWATHFVKFDGTVSRRRGADEA